MTPKELEARKKKKPYRQDDLRRRKYKEEENKALNFTSSRQQEGRKGGKGSGLCARRTRARMERERKEQEELHAMDKPKPLEVVSDGDLSEVKKDPEETKKAWEVWLEKEAPLKRMDARGRGIADEYHAGDVKTDKYGNTKTRKQEARNKPTKESVEQEESEAEREGKVAPSRVGRERFVRLEEGEEVPKKYNPDQDVDTKGKVIRGPSDRLEAVAHPSRLAGKIIGGKRKIQSGRRHSEDVEVGMKYPKMGEKENDYNISDLANISETEAEKLGPKEEKRGGRIHKPTRRGYGGVKSDRLNRKEEKKSWEVWLDNITKPIPTGKPGTKPGSFQHCINANQDKHNPGGWCKQIERKIGGGKKKGRDEGEKEEVKISAYDKLKRIKDRLQAHNKAKQTKIDKPKDWWDHSKVGRQGDIDQKTGRPWWEVAIEEEERKKKEKKKARPRTTGSGSGKAKNKRPPIKGISSYQQGPKKMEVTSPHGKGQQTGGKETGEGWQKYWDEHKDELLSYGKKKKIDKTDYFVEEIRANIIYHNKIFPLVGMIAGAAGKVGVEGAKIGGDILDGMKDLGSGVLQGVGEEAEEEQ